MRFGVREIAEVTFRPLAAMDIGKQHFEKYQPCLFIDTATASNMEVATTTVYAQGGRGNARLIAWEGEKTATFTITDALLSPISFSMLSGAGVIDSNAGTKIVHLTLEGEIKYSTGDSNDSVIVQRNDFLGYKIITETNPPSKGNTVIEYDEYKIFGMVLDDQQVSVVDYLGEGEILGSTINSSGNLEITLDGHNEDLVGHICRVDCYAITETAQVTTLTVDAENFGGTFYIEAETLFRDEATGHDFPATFIIPKGKIQGNFTFSMAATGDPSTFDFTIDCTLGTLRGETKKVLYAIDIIDNISSDSHAESSSENLDYPNIDLNTGDKSYTHNSYSQSNAAKTRLTANTIKVTANQTNGVTEVKNLLGEDEVLSASTDYDVTYQGEAGSYTGYTITFKGDYSGIVTGTISSS